MPSYCFPQLADDTVLQAFDASISQTCVATATMLAYLAEVDHRKLYVRAAYSSMHQYCVHEKHMSEHTANKRIRVARIAREFPAVFPALADGRLRLSAVLLLGPHLTAGTADELLAAAAHRTNAEIELLLAARFPRPDVPTLVQACAGDELAVRRVAPSSGSESALQVEPLSRPRAGLAPLSPGRFALQFTVDQATHDKLRYAQALLGHALPPGDVVRVFERALDALVNQLEKQKFAKCARSRPQGGAPKGRHIPAAVKRAVWERDGGQCAFVNEQGKRQQGRERTARARAEANATTPAREPELAQAAAEAASQEEVVPWLRALGCNTESARRAAARCVGMVGAPLEKRVYVAVQGLATRGERRIGATASNPA